MSGRKNKIEDLRDHLFATLEELRDKDVPLEQSVQRAKAVAEVSRTIIDSAKVEVAFLQVTGAAGGTGFIPDQRQIETSAAPALAQGPRRVRR